MLHRATYATKNNNIYGFCIQTQIFSDKKNNATPCWYELL